MNTHDLALRALVTKHVVDVATEAIAKRRAELAEAMRSGDRVTITAPDEPDREVGMVWRTKPKGAATITDEAAFTGWMTKHCPERVQCIPTILDVDIGEAIQVLRRHAPHLVTSAPRVMPWAVNEVLKLTEAARQPCGPGGETDIPGVTYEPPKPGTVTVKLSDDGPAVIERLWREGRVELRTGEVLELPEGSS